MESGFVFALLALARWGAADEEWTRARSPRIEVLTNASAAEARRAAEHVDALHRVLQSALAPLPRLFEGSRPPLVLGFRDRQSFSRFLPLRNGEPQQVDGIILGGADRTLIAVNLGADGETSGQALAHEYTHFALNPVLPAQPPWLGEGLAELLAAATHLAAVGDPGTGVRRAPPPDQARGPDAPP